LATLAELGGEMLGEDTIARHDAMTIVIPRDMEKETAVTVLQRSIKDEQQVYQIRPHLQVPALRRRAQLWRTC
jgi:hypothetical protein